MAATEGNVAESEVLYVSRYDNKVDEKRRVQIPSGWRRGQGGGRYMMLAVPKGSWRAGCLVVMPMERYVQKVREVREMKMSDDRADSLRRLLATRASEVELDTAGRVCLPEEPSKAVGIVDRAVLAGMMDWFEIWNPERYAQVEAGDDERSGEAFALI